MKNILRLGDKLSLNIKGFNPIFILKNNFLQLYENKTILKKEWNVT